MQGAGGSEPFVAAQDQSVDVKRVLIFVVSVVVLILVLFFAISWGIDYFGRTDTLPGYEGEHHLPGYRYCGPGTAYAERRARGDKPINALDDCCMRHDRRYDPKSGLTTREADNALLRCAADVMPQTWEESVDRGGLVNAIGRKQQLEDAKIISPALFSGKN